MLPAERRRWHSEGMRDLESRPISTLLGVWAHPDDEAYLSSALMARVRRRGGRVVVVTATRGEHGTPDPERWPPDRLGPLRVRELAESLAILDVKEHHWLGYVDGTLADVDAEPARDRISAVIADAQPEVILTFGPDGMTGHTDHQAVCHWVTEAWQGAGRPGELWYATKTPQWHERWERLNAELGVMFEGADPPSTPPEDLVAEVACLGELRALKLRALRAHASQTGPLEELLGSERFADWISTESFVAAG